MIWTRGRLRISPSEWLLYGTLTMMACGCVNDAWGQSRGLYGLSQDSVNAMLWERQEAFSGRLEKLESLLQYAIMGLAGNLIAHLYQIRQQRKGNQDDA